MRGVHSSSDADDDMADAVADCNVIEVDTNAEDTVANGSKPKTTSFIPAVLHVIAVVGIVPMQ